MRLCGHRGYQSFLVSVTKRPEPLRFPWIVVLFRRFIIKTPFFYRGFDCHLFFLVTPTLVVKKKKRRLCQLMLASLERGVNKPTFCPDVFSPYFES
jgi:hypothetical protein